MLAIGVAGAAIGCGTAPSFLRGDADPGGMILAALLTVEQAVPPEAKVTLHQEYEPRWDSCDGRAGTFGWIDVIVIVDFTTDEQADTLATDTATALLTQGWQHTATSITDLGPSMQWTRTVAGSAAATATRAVHPQRGRCDHRGDHGVGPTSRNKGQRLLSPASMQ